ncbi:hypothetical protein QJS10_CPA07g00994 [Acorus calamus]|uniref:Cytochrome P450 n=1 Tax=Acorus calamus TaxID=4465 RepID=A0AAV9EKV8_ACOCL|nr:hypothetical protein QJS10_CPA07g00994 [Acorus calamus]
MWDIFQKFQNKGHRSTKVLSGYPAHSVLGNHARENKKNLEGRPAMWRMSGRIYWVRRVPGPPLITIVGHLPLLLKHGPDVFNALAKEYGPIFRFYMGRQPLIIIADPELCREVCIKKFKDMPNRSKIPPASGSPLHEKNLFLSRDSRWSTMRNAIVVLYQPSHLSNLIPIMQSFIDSTTRNLTTTKEEEDITFSNLSLMLAIDVLGQAAFGVDFGLSKGDSKSVKDDEVSRFIDAHIYSTQCLKMDMSGSLSIQLGLLFPFLQTPLRKFLRWIPWTTDHWMRSNEKKLCERLTQLIAMRMSDKDRSSRNMLSVVLNARDSKVDAFTPDYVMGLAYEHLLAGSATTSFTLSMAIYLVSKHLEVIKETMRFRSVSPLVARETNKEVEIGGYILPKGTWIWPALGVPVKDPKHFPEHTCSDRRGSIPIAKNRSKGIPTRTYPSGSACERAWAKS